MNLTRPRAVLLSTVVLAVLTGLSACGSDTASQASTPDASSETSPSPSPRSSDPAEEGDDSSADSQKAPEEDLLVVIKDFAYSSPSSVAAGATVTVVNDDRSAHSFTIAAEGIEVVLSGGGDSGTFTAPSKPGEYTITCKFHPEMSGILVVA